MLIEIDKVKPAPEATTDREVSLLEILITLATRRWWILELTLIMASIGIIASFALPSRYTASTSILPPQNNTSGAALMSQVGNLGSVGALAAGSLGLKNPNDLQVAMLKSETVENAMVDRFHLEDLYHAKRRSDAIKKLEKVTDIDNGSKDGVIRISTTDRSPERAAAMANAYVEEFKRFSATLAVGEASQRRLFFESQLIKAKEDLANAEEELKKTEQKTGVMQLDVQTRAVIESVARLRAQIGAKEVQIRAMRSYATAANPDLMIAEEELAGLRAQEEQMDSHSGSESNSLLVPSGAMQQSGLEYVRKLREVKYSETMFDLLARQFEAAKVDEARQGAVVQVIDPARVPDHRSWPKRTWIVLASTCFGLCVGVVWVLAEDKIARSMLPAERERLGVLVSLVSFGNRRRTFH